ncbi:MAG TPA: NAD(P)(+) transhydrogenase (Re/Si-specific) subunit beta, partial [Solirubrobacteraceae bacterium]|nr:NAD(P)(+) transhydrogenase (Re/Si-specific) subunit beta [Solirubrobacteraceae bacterium]
MSVVGGLPARCHVLLLGLRHHPAEFRHLALLLARHGVFNGPALHFVSPAKVCAAITRYAGPSSLSFATAKSTSFIHNANFLDVLYIVAFALFIYGLSGLTGPRTAVRGNRIAAVGMAIAIVATLLKQGEGNWGLIVIGIALGT